MSTMTTMRPPAVRTSSAPVRGAKHSLTSTIDPMRVLRRHALGIALSAGVGGVVGVGAYLLLDQFLPLYSGEVLFEVQPGLRQAGQIGTDDFGDDATVYRLAQTETYMLTSRDVLSAALTNPEIKQTRWHQKFQQTNSEGRSVFNTAEALDELEEDLSTNVFRNSNLFSLRWSAPEPRDVPILLSAISEAYINGRKARDEAAFTANHVNFTKQVVDTENQMDALALEIRNLIQTANITELDGVWHSAQATMSTQLTGKLADASAMLNYAKSAYELAASKLQGKAEPTQLDIIQAENDTAVVNQIENIQQFKAHERYLLETRQKDDPTVIQARQRIQAAEDQKDAKVKELTRRNLEARARQYAEDTERYRFLVEELESELEKNQAVLKDLAAEQSKYEALRTRREHLEVQRTENLKLITEIQLMRVRDDARRVRLFNRAMEPRQKSFPKVQVIVPLGVLCMVGIMVGFVFLRELMDQRVKSASDLAVLPGANLLGGIPDLIDEPSKIQTAELAVRRHPLSVLAESYRQAAATIQSLIDRNGHQTVLFVGGLPASGTTTVVTNMAAAMAAAGRKVLMIDANFRRPRLAEAMGVPDNASDGLGLGDLLGGSATIDQVVIDAGQDTSLIGAGTPASRVFDRLNNGAFDSALAELRGRFDLILIDSPPAVVAGDAFVLANKVDAAVLVVRAHQEHRGLVARMIHRFADARCDLLGVLLNRPRGTAGGYLKKNYATMAEYTAKISS